MVGFKELIDWVKSDGLPSALILILVWQSPKYLETARKWRINTLSYELKRRKLDAQRDGDHSHIRSEVKKRKEARQ